VVLRRARRRARRRASSGELVAVAYFWGTQKTALSGGLFTIDAPEHGSPPARCCESSPSSLLEAVSAASPFAVLHAVPPTACPWRGRQARMFAASLQRVCRRPAANALHNRLDTGFVHCSLPQQYRTRQSCWVMSARRLHLLLGPWPVRLSSPTVIVNARIGRSSHGTPSIGAPFAAAGECLQALFVSTHQQQPTISRPLVLVPKEPVPWGVPAVLLPSAALLLLLARALPAWLASTAQHHGLYLPSFRRLVHRYGTADLKFDPRLNPTMTLLKSLLYTQSFITSSFHNSS
jgi:hypothetical protein